MILFKKISVFILPAHMEKIKEIAEKRGMRFAELLRKIMSDFVERQADKNQ